MSNEKLPELKPCPWCGENNTGETQGEDGYALYCASCGASGPWHESDSITAWNTRAPSHLLAPGLQRAPVICESVNDPSSSMRGTGAAIARIRAEFAAQPPATQPDALAEAVKLLQEWMFSEGAITGPVESTYTFLARHGKGE